MNLNIRNLGKLFLLASLCLALLVACQPSSQRTRPVEPDNIEQLRRSAAIQYQQQNFRAAANLYTQLQNLDRANRNRWILRAADALLQADAIDMAQQTLQVLDNRNLSASQLAYWQLLRVELALTQADFDAARLLAAKLEDLAGSLSDSLLQRWQNLQQLLLEQSSSTTRAILTELTGSRNEADQFRAFTQLIRQPGSELQQLYTVKSSLQESTWLAAALSARQQAVARQFELQTNNPDLTRRLSQQQQDFIQQYLAQADYPANIAVILPESGPLAPAGNAIRKGIISGWLQLPANQRPGLHFIDAGVTSANAVGAFYSAAESGADWIIGPLQRESVEAVINLPARNIPLLALNQPATPGGSAPTTGNQLPASQSDSLLSDPMQSTAAHSSQQGFVNEYIFALPPEDDARSTANIMFSDGHRMVVVLSPDDQLGTRLRDAFIDSFTALGGSIMSNRVYSSDQIEFSNIIKDGMSINASVQRHQQLQSLLGQELGFRQRSSADAVFLTGTAQQARLILPQLKFLDLDYLPVYATERAYSKPDDSAQNRDLNRLQFTSPAWLYGAQPAPSINLVKRWDASLNSLLFGKLFALGRDSLLLTPYLDMLHGDNSLKLQGYSGQLQVSADGVVERSLQRVRYRNGQPVLARETDVAGQ